MMDKYTFLYFIFFLFANFTVLSQSDFVLNDYMFEANFSTIGMISTDLNGDLTDDLVVLDDGREIKVYLNNQSGEKWKEYIGPTFTDAVWATIASDFNNDGNMEIVIGRSYSRVEIYSFNADTGAFSEYWSSAEIFYAQNMNTIDINNDGFLDLFMCNDDGLNLLYVNDKNGSFNSSNMIDFSTNPLSDNSGNYGSVWTDVNGDGLLDLYIAKCRFGAVSDTDPRRINQLFINLGNNQFVEQAKDYGIDYGEQTWVANFGDLDNDGDQDLVVLNHEDPWILAENVNNESFVKKDLGNMVSKDLFWQGYIQDLDNDGLLDLAFLSDKLYLYKNLGNFEFEPFTIDYNFSSSLLSGTIGDFNRDGKSDFMISSSSGFTFGGNDKDHAFLNQIQNAGNYLDIALEGTVSNPHGIGAKLLLYQKNKIQTRYVKSGYSYGVMPTLKQHFGLEDKPIDSLIIEWPSGLISKIISPESNRVLYVLEGECAGYQEEYTYASTTPCTDIGYDLNYTGSGDITWSNNETNNEIMYNGEEPVYGLVNENDCTVSTPVLFPEYQETGIIESEVEVLDYLFPYCANEIVTLQAPEGLSYKWPDGSDGDSYVTTEAGEFVVYVEQECQEQKIIYSRSAQSINVEWPTQPFQTTETTNIPLFIAGDSIHWFEDMTSQTPIHIGNEYILPSLSGTEKLYVEALNKEEYLENPGIQMPDETGGYPPSHLNPSMFFEVQKDIVLASIDSYTDTPFDRKIQILKEGELIFETTSFIDAPFGTFDLNVPLSPGNYEIRTDVAYNLENFGSDGPFLYRDVPIENNYPYTDNMEYLKITNSSFNSSGYYFFYNWKIVVGPKVCVSERMEITVEGPDSIEEQELISMEYNNPVQNILKTWVEQDTEAIIYDAIGKRVLSLHLTFGHNEFDVSQWSPGLYYIQLENGTSHKLIKL